METSSQEKPHIAIMPSPGMGHLIPLSEFAKQLVLNHDFFVTFIIPDFGFSMKSQKSFLESLPKTINVVYLPPSPVISDHPSSDMKPEIRITHGTIRSLPALRELFKGLTKSSRLVALVVDVIGTDPFDVAREFGLLPYIFVPFSAMSLSLFLHFPKIDEAGIIDYKNHSKPFHIPGCVPISGSQLPEIIQNRNNESYQWALHHCKGYNLVDGLIINSFLDLEPGAFKALMEGGLSKPPIYPIGPLLQTGPTSDDQGNNSGTECLRWLDDQPRGSVLFVCFGSSGTLSHEQFNELAFGLEMSKQSFVWVVRSPDKTSANAVHYNAQSSVDPFDFLPKGFIDRTNGLGLLVRSWASQVQILSHCAIGGFLSHCGWNSILESVVHGVPLIAWPLYAEQEMLSVMVTQGLKVALRPKKNENGLVSREEIAEKIKCLIVGEEGKLLGERMRDLKIGAAKATSEDGQSTKSLIEVIKIWKNHKTTLI